MLNFVTRDDSQDIMSYFACHVTNGELFPTRIITCKFTIISHSENLQEHLCESRSLNLTSLSAAATVSRTRPSM